MEQRRTDAGARMEAKEIIELLGLEPHPQEGGYFTETYRAPDTIEAAGLDPRYGGRRSASTAIYYLLTPETFSALHRLKSDEVFHFYLGDPVRMLQLAPEGSGKVVLLGTDLKAGQRPQALVKRGVWQGARLAEGGRWALLGCTVAPGFDFADYEHGRREKLLGEYPEFEREIRALTAED